MNEKLTPSKPDKLEIYKMIVEMADRVSQRRQSANNFYLTMNTILIGGTSFLYESGLPVLSSITLSIAGLSISLLWARNIKSYKTLNSAKFRVITDLEKQLEYDAYTKEWEFLDPDGDGKRHNPFHKVEGLVPFVFVGVYIIHLAAHIPWHRLASACGC
ncbi:hypothetical protein JI743_07990 [Sphingopyxis sp. DHUNG17]|uniref:RipA family octameric membrane protein n=1 Tax=Sphingopyxis jiangsuensis TaxID=2871171 RepID=UPI00191DD9FA|nr:hypothetical protein [Sphingopyxis lutea]MBL0768741.1 hypothetical protein [Sphingopyxis lutea]